MIFMEQFKQIEVQITVPMIEAIFSLFKMQITTFSC